MAVSSFHEPGALAGSTIACAWGRPLAIMPQDVVVWRFPSDALKRPLAIWEHVC